MSGENVQIMVEKLYRCESRLKGLKIKMKTTETVFTNLLIGQQIMVRGKSFQSREIYRTREQEQSV